MVFGLAVLNRVWYYEPRDCEQSLSSPATSGCALREAERKGGFHNKSK